MQDNKPKTVFVGLSGGVDSSVAALRLIKEGYNVVGVFIKVWQPDFLECDWETERLDAMRVAAKLDIPFLTCDAEQAYKDDVADYFIDSYSRGLTPNPDVMCNKYVKFGAFLTFAEEHGADFIATGHYAQRFETQGSNSCIYELHRGIDENKDQSYFLWTLTQEQLAKVLLPVGNSTKETIRKEAGAAGLLTAGKKDSQGICFLGQVDIPDFLSHYIELNEGDVLSENGEVIGIHRGALVYTTGQRHGFTITSADPERRPHYVTERNIEANTITVSCTKPAEQLTTSINLTEVNLIGEPVSVLSAVTLQSRYRQAPTACKIRNITPDTMKLELTEPSESVSKGQSCVLYDGTRCIGGGIIS